MASPTPAQMDIEKLGQVTRYLIEARRQESLLFNAIHEWVRNRVIAIYVPEGARQEYKQLVEQSRWNIFPTLLDSLVNELFIDGYRPNPVGASGKRRAKDSKNAPVWNAVWQPNRMDARQSGVWRTAAKYGLSYVRVLPGELNGKKSALLTPFSPRRLTALYRDALNDEWAEYALEVGTDYPEFDAAGTRMVTPVTVYDNHHSYRMELPATMLATKPYSPFAKQWAYEPINIDVTKAVAKPHGLGYCPVVRFLDTWGELDEGPEGIVMPMLPAQLQINQTTYSLGMAELFAAFRQKWVSGLEKQEDEEGNPIEPFSVNVDKLLQAEDPDTKFGDFQQTDLSGYLSSRDRTMLYVAAARHIEPHKIIVGDSVSNVSAEALMALRDAHGQDVAAHRTSLGESAEQMLRLAGRAMGDMDAWEDTSAQVRWRDTTPRSLAQIADALGKLAQGLEIPPEWLWERIPDVTDQDLAEIKQLAKERDSIAKFDGLVNDARSRRQPVDQGASSAPGSDI